MTELEENFQIPDIDLKKFDAEFFTEPIKEDEVPEPPKVAITKPGDLWEFGDHRLLCGDSCKDWPFDGKAEMMFTDPPYGVEYEGGHFHSGDVNIKRKRDDLKGDDVDVYGPFLKAIEKRIDGPCYVWFAGSRAWTIFSAVEEVGADVHAMIIWNKTNATYAAMNAQYKQRHEPCLYFKFSGSTLRWVGHSDECTVWDEKRDSRNDLHPTQKPVCLAARAIKNHEAKTVFDGFAGSGSTLIAAEQLNRRCYAIEIEPKYCDVIVERWENLTGGKATRKRV
jgi:DNA modification methylase